MDGTAVRQTAALLRSISYLAQATRPFCSTRGYDQGQTSSRLWRSARRAVGIGWPYAYGLALDGVDGIVHVLRCILAEADLLIDGYPRIADLEPSSLLALR
jgi:lactate 2-monooxygenase